VANPYWGSDGEARLHNLRTYLTYLMQVRPSMVLVGEAPGYRGARVSGLPFTSERQLTGAGPAEATATIVQSALAEVGVEHDVLDAGCCGLAGSFGYHRGEHYDVSMRIGERVLLPAVRAASDDVFVVADGFSCRQQIAHGTGRRAVHVAELIRLALAQEVR
jgi:hypothetical protein